MLPNGGCNQCNGGTYTNAEKRTFCGGPEGLGRLQRCVDPLLGRGPERGRGKHGFLVKYDHLAHFEPLSDAVRLLKTRGVGVIHITRDPLFIWLSLKDHSYKNKHGGAYKKHTLKHQEYATYHKVSAR